jgi:hypothetical protein
MRLSDESIERVLGAARVKSRDFNFATLQSAATSTELVAQLCIEAMRPEAAKTPPRKAGGLVAAIKKIVG